MINQNLLLTGDAGYNLTKSLRFRSSASAYLNRTFTNEQGTYTLSLWVKRGTLGVQQEIANSRTSGAGSTSYIEFNSSDQINIQLNGTSVLTTTAVYRDPASWYQIILSVTASATSYLYVNGTQIGSWTAGSNPFLFSNGAGYVCAIGRQGNLSAQYFDGYMAEVNYIDGQALTPSSFGETSTTTGVWIPKKYTGTYGTNGFYLPFTDTTSTSTLGTDFSGNSNTWTVNNISLTAGSTYDSMNDVPTLTSATTANYCVWSPINKSSTQNVTNGNLTASSSGGTSYGALCATMGVTSGKWYWEMLYTRNGTSNSPVIGFGNDLFTYTNPPGGYLGSDLNAGGVNVFNGNAAINGTSTAYGSAIATNDIVMFAMDLDNRKFYVGKNGTWFNSGNPVTQANPWSYSATIVGSTFFPAVNMFNDTGDTNFGQRPFTYTPPTGFVALNTFNLPTPTIGATASTTANKYMDATTYTGTGASLSVVNAGGFQPDFVWTKPRSTAVGHTLFDSIRGVTNYLQSNTTGAEGTAATSLTAFNTNGFTVNSDTSTGANGVTYVGWQWRASNATAVTNTAGSITSTVSANTTAGFSVVTWTGNSTNAATIGHGLGVAPSILITKSRTNLSSWVVGIGGLSGFGVNDYLVLQSTAAKGSSSTFYQAYGSSTFTTGVSAADEMNKTGNNYVTYCFAPVAGYSAFGSYTGNGSTDGPFVFTGFRPRFLMIKATSSESNADWLMYDTARNIYNTMNTRLWANLSAAETSDSAYLLDCVSNGFKIRTGTANVGYNNSGGTYIYMAFAESPFKYANAR